MTSTEGPDGILELTTGTAKIKRDGNWQVPVALLVRSVTGAVDLDFSEAEFAGRNVDIELQVGTGAVHLTLPRGASVHLGNLLSGTGSLRVKTDQGSTGSPRFTVHGAVATGAVKIGYPGSFNILGF